MLTEESLRAAYARFIALWQEGRLEEAVRRIYAEDAVLIAIDGRQTAGIDGILDAYRSRFPDRSCMGQLTITLEQGGPEKAGWFVVINSCHTLGSVEARLAAQHHFVLIGGTPRIIRDIDLMALGN